MRLVRLDGRLGEASSRSGCRTPIQEVGDGPVVSSFALLAVDGIEHESLEAFDVLRSRVGEQGWKIFQARPL